MNSTSATTAFPDNTEHAIDLEVPVRTLQRLRDELDRIDATLLETVRERLECCCRIGEHKRQHAIPMMQPQRIGLVQQRAAAFAQTHDMSTTFLRTLYDLIIAETCRLEDQIIGSAGTKD